MINEIEQEIVVKEEMWSELQDEKIEILNSLMELADQALDSGRPPVKKIQDLRDTRDYLDAKIMAVKKRISNLKAERQAILDRRPVEAKARDRYLNQRIQEMDATEINTTALTNFAHAAALYCLKQGVPIGMVDNKRVVHAVFGANEFRKALVSSAHEIKSEILSELE